MSSSYSLSESDRRQLDAVGISLAEAERQLGILTSPSQRARLVRPCTPGDGILVLAEEHQEHLLEVWQRLPRERRLEKVVPASGAATRMFKELTRLQQHLNADRAEDLGDLRASAESFCQSIDRFAFYPALSAAMASRGQPFGEPLEIDDLRPVLDTLLEPTGLGYRTLPKGLIPFHGYPEDVRTAAEEHLWEGAGYLCDNGGTARLHYTVPVDFRSDFSTHLETATRPIEDELEISFEISLSTQSPSTDTLAVDVENRVFRVDDGTLLLRPAGHGALLRNLQDLDADVVYIKNIDNIAHRRLHPVSRRWKQILGGLFLELQSDVFELLDRLAQDTDPAPVLADAEQLAAASLAFLVPNAVRSMDLEERRSFWIERLDRPLRVCGVVENTAEPGGGPFWLETSDDATSGQIVESAQVDLSDPDQQQIWTSSTHFNPVDLVCGLTDREGRRYELDRFVDPSTTIVAQKSHGGRSLKAMERPGLWNGSMARWNTAFVEVPLATFTPVKTVFDLLRPEHQG